MALTVGGSLHAADVSAEAVSVGSGTYPIGTTIDITITWDGGIDYTRGGLDATISLTGGFTATCTTGGSGATNVTELTFQFTVDEGTDVTGLDYSVASINLNGTTIEDTGTSTASGLTLGTFPQSGIDLDRTRPTVTSILRNTPSGQDTNASTVIFKATFAEDMDPTTVDAADFEFLQSLTGGTILGVSQVSGQPDEYLIIVSGYTADGSLEVDIKAAPSVSDAAGNALTDDTVGSSEVYDVDTDAPGVTSIVRQSPTAASTNAASVTFRVTFDEDVQNVTTGDFSIVAGSGLTGAVIDSVTEITASTVYDVVIDSYSGEDSLDLDFASDQDVMDLAGNVLSNATPSGSDESYTLVDTVAPTAAITAVSPDPIAPDAGTVTIVFSESVSNVTKDDFTLTDSGGSVTITNNPSGSGDTWTLDLSPDTGTDETYTLTVLSSSDIADAGGNTLAADDSDGFTVASSAAPTVTSITRNSPSSEDTNSGIVIFQVTFSEDMDASTVDAADFDVDDPGSDFTGESVTGVAQNGANADEYLVTVSGYSGEGVLGLDLDASPTLDDLSGLSLTNTTPSGADETYTIDSTAPRVASIVRQSPTGASTNATSVTFRVTFNEDVQNVGSGDFDIVAGSGLTGSSIDSVTEITASTVYDVVIDSYSGEDSLDIDFASDQDITDLAGNVLSNTTPTGSDESYTLVDTVVPTATVGPVTPDPISPDAGTVTIVFSESVSNVTKDDFTLTDSGGSVTITNSPSGSGTTYTLDLSPDTGTDETYTLTVLSNANGSDIVDAGGNVLAADFDDTFQVSSSSAPTVTSITRNSPSSENTNSSAVVFLVTFSEDMDSGTVNAADFEPDEGGTLSGGSVSGVSQNGGNADQYLVTISGYSGEGALGLDLAASPTLDDLDSNALINTTPASEETYTIDSTAPRIATIVRQSPTGSSTNSTSVTFRVTFDEDVNNVGTADFSPVMGSGLSGAAIDSVTTITASTVYDVVVDSYSGSDTLGLTLDAGQDIADDAGNSLTNSTPTTTDEEYNPVDLTDPTLSSMGPASDPISGDAGTITIVFSEPVSNVDITDFTLTYDTTASNVDITGLSVSGTGPTDTWTLDLSTVTSTVGDYTLDLAAGGIVDERGNSYAGGDSDSFEVTVANNAPTETTNTGLTLARGSSETIQSTELEYDDIEDPDTDIIFYVVSPPSDGDLQLDSDGIGGADPVTLVADDTFTQDDINNGRVSYTHDSSTAISDLSDLFTFRVVDPVTEPSVASQPLQQFDFTMTTGDPAFVFGDVSDVEFDESTGTEVSLAPSPSLTLANSMTDSGTVTVEILDSSGSSPSYLTGDLLYLDLEVRDPPGVTVPSVFINNSAPTEIYDWVFSGTVYGEFDGTDDGSEGPLTVNFTGTSAGSTDDQETTCELIIQGLKYDNASGTLPSSLDRLVRITWTDAAGKTTSDTKTLRVIGNNDAPTWDGGNRLTYATRDDGVVTGTVLAIDPESEAITYSVDATSFGSATIDADTGEFTYTPTPGLIGDATVDFIATDAGGASSVVETVTIEISASDSDAPLFVTDPPVYAVDGESPTFTMTVDYVSTPGSTPSFSFEAFGDVPSGLQFTPSTSSGTTVLNFSGTIATNSSGVYSFRVVAVDSANVDSNGNGLVAVQEITLRVIDAPGGGG